MMSSSNHNRPNSYPFKLSFSAIGCVGDCCDDRIETWCLDDLLIVGLIAIYRLIGGFLAMHYRRSIGCC